MPRKIYFIDLLHIGIFFEDHGRKLCLAKLYDSIDFLTESSFFGIN